MSHTPGPACELRSGHFSIFIIRVHVLDLDAVTATLADHVDAAPDLLSRAPAVLELPDESAAPSEELLRDLLERVRYAGLSPLGFVAEADSTLGVTVQRCKLPLLAPERRRQRVEEAVESATVAAPAPVRPEAAEPAASPEPAAGAASPVAAPAPAAPPESLKPLVQTEMVRSGQRIYARGRDLILLGPVSYGAEVIADGSIYSFHRLQGKVLAGAQGDESARIVCTRFDPELVSIAGNYRVIEKLPEDLKDRVVQVRLVGERLEMLPL